MSLPKTLEPQFELIEHLPGGKICDCFRVKERKEKRARELVLRLLPASFNDNQALIDEFHGFFLKLSNLTNRSHIPIVYSVSGTIGGPVYVLEQYVSGVSLPEYIERDRNSEIFIDDLTEIVVRVCEALHFAHQKDIFHCCITNDDILIDPDNPRKVKLVGFGAQILIKTNCLSDISSSLQKFIAPEIASGGMTNSRCDIYSLAMALSEACPEISFWNDLLAKSQSKDPLQRPSSAREFGRELRKLADTSNKQVAENESGDLIAGGLNPVLTIKTDPTGAEVKANGNTLGVTSVSGLMAPWKPGTVLEIRKTGYSTETLDLSTPPDNTEIVVKLSSALTLYTNPWGASVLVDGKQIGVTDRDGLMVPWDGSTIGIEKAGYKSESLKFLSPPTENQSSVELQPAISSVAPKRHPLEVVGYAMAAIVLWLLPLVIYGGLHTAGVGEKVTDKDSQIANLVSNNVKLQKEVDQKDEEIYSAKKTLDQERLGAKKEIERLSGEISQLTGGIANLRGDLNKRDDEIARLKKVELEKERLEREIPSLKSEADRWRKDYYSQNQAITAKDKEIGELRKSLESEKQRGDATQRKLTEKENEITTLSSRTWTQQSAAIEKKAIDSGLNSELLLACTRGDSHSVEWLLDRGANPNARDSSGSTPLMLAAFDGRPAVVKLILRYGGDPYARSKAGYTAEEIALKQGQRECASILAKQILLGR